MNLTRLTAICVTCVFLMTMTGASAAAEVKSSKKVVGYGRKVTFDYVLTVDGKEFDSSKTSGQVTYKQGDGTIIPGLAKQLQGLAAGDEKSITVKSEDAYGKVDPKGIREAPLSAMSNGIELKSGTILQGKNPDGRTFPVKIVEVRKDTVVVDHNHPLAGKTLDFKVKIVAVE
jgi:FKBP-type peptidyl-prolyl cis-trans isomerase SlyD